MARQARYEAAGAIYHVMARGDGGRDVFEDDRDRLKWLDRLEEVCGKYGWRVHAYGSRRKVARRGRGGEIGAMVFAQPPR